MSPALAAQGTETQCRRTSRSIRPMRLALYALATTCALIFLGPLAWMVLTALKAPRETYKFPPHILPAAAQWDNFVTAWTTVDATRLALNTLFIMAVTVPGVLITSSLCAFGFARLQFTGRDAIFMCLLASVMLPSQVTLIPLYIIFKHLQWLDSFKPLTIPAWCGGGALNVFLLRQSFLALPRELDEAARIDGCTTFGLFWRIALPLVKPALAVVTVIQIQVTWTDFMGPLIYLNSPEKFTLALGLYALQSQVMQGDVPENILMALAVLMVIPIAVVFLVAQRQLTRSAVLSGLKG